MHRNLKVDEAIKHVWNNNFEYNLVILSSCVLIKIGGIVTENGWTGTTDVLLVTLIYLSHMKMSLVFYVWCVHRDLFLKIIFELFLRRTSSCPFKRFSKEVGWWWMDEKVGGRYKCCLCGISTAFFVLWI